MYEIIKFGDIIQRKDDTLLYIGLSNTGQHLAWDYIHRCIVQIIPAP